MEAKGKKQQKVSNILAIFREETKKIWFLEVSSSVGLSQDYITFNNQYQKVIEKAQFQLPSWIFLVDIRCLSLDIKCKALAHWHNSEHAK